MSEIIAGLVGATFVFFFIRLSDFLTKIFEREDRNYKTLISYSHILNGYYLINVKNIKIIDNYLEQSGSEKLDVTFDVFHEYPIEKDIIQMLTNVDLIKELFTFNSIVLNLNQNFEVVSRNNNIIARGLLDGNIEHGFYKETINKLRENLKYRRKELIDLFQDIRSLLYAINYLSERKPVFYKIIHKLSNSKLPQTFFDERKIELSKPIDVLEKLKELE